ncbi:hypothetical protein [Phenylobacterium sp.]|uniref:hypothetical protein n=1 Tax=Phenylobacterium sp. TaxID=1871053 RepID=UPI002FC780A4
MTEEAPTNGRTPVLGQILSAWESLGAPRTWDALTTVLGGLAESLCLITWRGSEGLPIIEQAGVQAVMVQGTALVGCSADALTPGRGDGAREASRATQLMRPFTVEDAVHDRRIARLYLPLDGTSPVVACAVIRID